MKEFYLDIKDVEEINFAAAHKMMTWWIKNGYNPRDDILFMPRDFGLKEWVRATGHLTSTLRSKWESVHFLGKGMRTLLDGD